MQTGHILVGFLSMVCVLFLGTALGDGRSVIIIKANSSLGLTDGYGVGVFTDSRGNDWTDKAHPMEALDCEDHQRRGQGVKAFSMIALITACVAVLVSLLGASEGGAFGKVNAGLQAVMVVSFLLAMALGFNLVEGDFSCNPAVNVTLDVKLKDYFEYNYGCFFLLAGTVVSLLNIALLAATGSLSGAPAHAPAPAPAANEPTAEIETKQAV